MDRFRKILAILGNHRSINPCNRAHLGDGALLAPSETAVHVSLGIPVEEEELYWKDLNLETKQVGIFYGERKAVVSSRKSRSFMHPLLSPSSALSG